MKKFLLLSVFLLVLAIPAGFLYQILKPQGIEPVDIEIKKGSSAVEIANLLKEKGVIENKTAFLVLATLLDRPLKYGFYRFEGPLSLLDVWNILSKGKQRLIKITIIPGEDLIDVGQKLDRYGIIPADVFYGYVFSEKTAEKLGITGKTLEGYIPPDTYFLSKNMPVERVVDLFLKNFHKKYSPVLKPVGNLNEYQVMVIASLVEKETALTEEKPVIAGIIINRLSKNMKLQIDPTIIYALKLAGKWDGNLTKKNMKINSPYNTYLYKGLPPTPISSFSVETLKAVINYQKTNYLYFYSKDGKKHIFSRSYREHIKNIKQGL
ncbi:endolytic transglycosylase MltG [Persephonella sp.]